MSVLAITGATGFVGGRTLALALEAGHSVRALTRRPQPAQAGVTWVLGALDTPDALAELVRGADAVVMVEHTDLEGGRLVLRRAAACRRWRWKWPRPRSLRSAARCRAPASRP